MEVKSCAQENLGKLLINIQSIWAVHALGDTSIVKIGKVRLSDKIGEGGIWNFEKNELYNAEVFVGRALNLWAGLQYRLINRVGPQCLLNAYYIKSFPKNLMTVSIHAM